VQLFASYSTKPYHRKRSCATIVEGLDAVETKCFQHEGRITETLTVPDYRTRRFYADLILKLKGWDVPPVEEDTATEITICWSGDQVEW
jgi:hypothetical protein